jgi:hypothetical protein
MIVWEEKETLLEQSKMNETMNQSIDMFNRMDDGRKQDGRLTDRRHESFSGSKNDRHWLHRRPRNNAY